MAAATDPYPSVGVAGINGPAANAFLITLDDSNDLPYVTRGISFGTAGAVKVTLKGGQTVIIPTGNLAAGVIHPLMATRVWNTGTTASNLVGYY